MSRKSSPHGLYCDSTRSRHGGNCNDAALWVVYWGDPESNEVKTNHACAYHLHKLLVALASKAEFSREMFRVIPADMLVDWMRDQEQQ